LYNREVINYDKLFILLSSILYDLLLVSIISIYIFDKLPE
jgi:hypothetical protein